MPWVVAVLLTLLTPRLAVVLIWFFSRWFDGLFASPLWPIVGFVFLPTTLLWYSAVHQWFGGAWTLWPLAGLVVALVIDLSPVREQYRLRNRRSGDLAAAST